MLEQVLLAGRKLCSILGVFVRERLEGPVDNKCFVSLVLISGLKVPRSVYADVVRTTSIALSGV